MVEPTVSAVMRVAVDEFSVVAFMFAMLTIVFSVLAMHRLCRVGNYISADRIACSPRIDNGGPEVDA